MKELLQCIPIPHVQLGTDAEQGRLVVAQQVARAALSHALS